MHIVETVTKANTSIEAVLVVVVVAAIVEEAAAAEDEEEEKEEEERMEEKPPSLTLRGIFADFLLVEKDPIYEICSHFVAFVVIKWLRQAGAA